MNSTTAKSALLALLVGAVALGQIAGFSPITSMPLGGVPVRDPDLNVVWILEPAGARLWQWDGTDFHLVCGDARPGMQTSNVVFDRDRRLLVAGDGQVWDGARWSQWTMSGNGAMAYDEARHRLVRLVSNSTDVVEWDGTHWVRITPPASPGFDGRLVWHPILRACVLAIGNPVSLWTWDGTQWSIWTANGPAGSGAGLFLIGVGYDPALARVVLHGTLPGSSVPGTWTFDGNQWTSLTTPIEMGRDHSAIAYDGVGMLRLGGGVAESPWRLEGQTWRRLPFVLPRRAPPAAVAAGPAGVGLLWLERPPDVAFSAPGSTLTFDRIWQRQAPANVPPPRRDAGLAWSLVDAGFILFGGRGAGGNVLTDTWLWNGADWYALAPPTSPNESLRLVSDPRGGVLGLPPFGSSAQLWQWYWDGTTWQTAPAHSGLASVSWLAAHDLARNVVGVTVSNQMWEWDGATWSNRGTTPVAPLAIGYRPDTQRLLVLGNSGAQAHEWDGIAWTSTPLDLTGITTAANLQPDLRAARLLSLHYAGTGNVDAMLTQFPAGAALFGPGCALGPSPGLVTVGKPTPGNGRFALRAVTFAPSAPSVLAMGFQQQNTHLGAGCVIRIASPTALLLTADALGNWQIAAPIPANANLLGIDILAQFVVVDPARSPLGTVTVSDGLRIRIGE